MRGQTAFVLLAILFANCSGESNHEDAGLHDAGSDAGEVTCEIPPEAEGHQDCGFDPGITFDHLQGAVLQLESADGELCARLERRDDSPTPGGSAYLWTLLDVRIGRKGSVAHVSDPQSLCWKVTHHNWTDIARAWSGTNRYELELTIIGGHGGDPLYLLTVFDEGPLDPEDTYCVRSGSSPNCGPIELFPVNQ